MRRFFAAFALALLLPVLSAQALPRTFVRTSAAGTTCTRASPCDDFQKAHDATDPGGEVDCLEGADFGSITVTKSITINCTGVIAYADGIAINAPNLVVRLRGLNIKSFGASDVAVHSAFPATIHIENCMVSALGASGGAIVLEPSGGSSRLYVTDSAITDSGANGIAISPSGSAVVRVVLNRTRIENNGADGVHSTTGAGANTLIVHARDSVVASNGSAGFSGFAGSQSIVAVTLDRTAVTLNQFGIQSGTDGGSTYHVILGRSTVMSNVIGLTSNAGSILSYANNHLTGNSTDTFTFCLTSQCPTLPTGLLSLK